VAPRFEQPIRIPRRSAAATAAPAVQAEAVLLGAALTVLVLVGSLTPFQFQWRGPVGLSWVAPTGEDLVVNLLVYLPVGFTLFGGLSRWLHRRSWAVVAAAAGAAGLSLGLETLQAFSAARWASWVDVLLNTAGGLAGALMAPGIGRAAEGVAGAVRRAWRQCPLGVMSLALTVGVVLHGLVPFDFIRNGAEFRASLLASQWWPIAERYTPPHAMNLLNPYAGLLSTLRLSGLFCLLAAVHALAQRALGRDGNAALAAGVGHAALVAVLVEVLQLFLRSRVFSTLDVCTAIVAGVAGAWLAAFAYDAWDAGEGRVRRRVPVRSAALAGVVVYQVTWLAASGLLSAMHGRPADWSCVPFAALFALPFVHAVGAMTRTVLAYVLLGSTLALLSWSATRSVRWVWVSACMVAVAVLAAWCRTGFALRLPDLTPACLAIIAVILCGTPVRLLRPVR